MATTGRDIQDNSTGPLHGITFIDLTQIYNGPYATYLAVMAGARVIKVEPPDGEHLRKRSATSGAALPFALLNGNKESITLNLKSLEGRKIFLELVEHADVLVSNFAPGVMERLGLSEDVIRATNARIICASGSGYGSMGRYRNYPAMDLTVQAMSGVMSITGSPDGPPMKTGPAICDFFGGVHLYAAIATALVERERTGIGRTVEVSMLEAVYHSLSSSLGMLYDAGDTPMRTGNRHGGKSLAPYNVYPAVDGHVAIVCNNDKHWSALARAIDRQDMLQDGRFKSMQERVRNIDALDAEIGAWTSQRKRAEIFETLMDCRIPCAPVRTLLEVVADSHLREQGMLAEISHPEFGAITVANSPLRFRDTQRASPRPSPRLGEHTVEILTKLLRYETSQIDSLRDAGAI